MRVLRAVHWLAFGFPSIVVGVDERNNVFTVEKGIWERVIVGLVIGKAYI